jgi:hypothetical protein
VDDHLCIEEHYVSTTANYESAKVNSRSLPPLRIRRNNLDSSGE